MSGRLIILPKKSWHPGKRENIEKVLRDERLAAEEAAAARERAREIAQEGIVETLTKKRSASQKSNNEGKEAATEKPPGRKRKRQGQDKDKDKEAVGGKGQGWGATLQHVNLFSDAEREAGKLLGQNADHQREKKEQELQTQQRSGLAPTALGEGSAELKDEDSQPWYTQVQPLPTVPDIAARTIRLGREVTGKEAEEAIKRDHGRKSRADPMGSLFRSNAQAPGMKGPVLLSKATGVESSDSASVELLNRAATHKDGTQRPRKGNRVKKDKRNKKEKKRKSKSTKERRRHSDRDITKTGDVGPAGAGDSRGHPGEAAGAERQQNLKELRSRRLAREGGERERQIRLLAEREMAGQSLPDERSMAYNNQYNAPAARQNRAR